MKVDGSPIGSRAANNVVHWLERVVEEQQWSAATAIEQYERDVRDFLQSSTIRVLVYRRRGEAWAAAFGSNTLGPERLGPGAQPFIFVAYSADYGTVATAYQVSGVETVKLPREVAWLR